MNRQTTAPPIGLELPFRVRLAGLWTSAMFCYAYSDLIGFYIPGRIDAVARGDLGLLGVASNGGDEDFCARVQEFDLELPVDDRLLLPDQLIHARLFLQQLLDDPFRLCVFALAEDFQIPRSACVTTGQQIADIATPASIRMLFRFIATAPLLRWLRCRLRHDDRIESIVRW